MDGKIAVFDSGLGGLTVLSALKRALPYEDFIYHGDSGHAPYGTKSDAELLSLNSAVINKLLENYDIKCFACGCNTTTSRVWDTLCARFSGYHFVGISPAIDWACAENQGKNVLVMGTDATMSSKKILNRMASLKNKANIIPLAAQDIVMAVERGITDTEEFRKYLETKLEPYREETDAVVLGCTHFPFVKDKISRYMVKKVRFYDAAIVVAAETKQLLETNRLLNQKKKRGSVLYLNSDPAKIPVEKKLLEEYSHRWR